ncbi:MAG: hypothetical protein JSU63_12760 [Phycisphaerales bacterium]|nr:MAG: hypothetical protein JSU63_12760 [Phycisphaerales bacterium]
MFRKAAIAFLVTAATGIVATGAVSYVAYPCVGSRIGGEPARCLAVVVRGLLKCGVDGLSASPAGGDKRHLPSTFFSLRWGDREYFVGFDLPSGNQGREDGDGSVEATQRLAVLSVPVWILAALFAVYPVVVFIHGPLRLRRRRRKGLCLNCGCDLSGTRRPECPQCRRLREGLPLY